MSDSYMFFLEESRQDNIVEHERRDLSLVALPLRSRDLCIVYRHFLHQYLSIDVIHYESKELVYICLFP